MRIKYFIYYQGIERTPTVRLWVSPDGSLTHTKYLIQNNINPKTLASAGEIFLFPDRKPYFNHQQSVEGYDPCSYADNLLKEKNRKRDMALIQRELTRSRIEKDPEIVRKSHQTYLAVLRAQKVPLAQRLKNLLGRVI